MVNNIRAGLISAKEGKQEGVDFLYYNTYQDQYRRIYPMVANLALSDEEKTRFTQDILAESYNFVFANINAVQSEEQFMDWLPKVIDDIAKRKIYEFLGSGAGQTYGVLGAETYEDGEEKGPGAGMATGAAVGAATGIGAAMFNGAYGAANVESAGSMVGASSIGGKAAAVGRSASAGRAVSVGNKALAGKAASAVEAGKGVVTASVKASGTIAKETVGAVAKETVGAVARETAGAVAKGAVAGVAKTGVFASVGAKIACAVACVAVLGGTATGVILHLHDKDKEVIAEPTTEATSEVAVSEETTTEGTTEITTEATTEVTTEAPPPEPYEIAVSEIPEKDSLYVFLNKFENYGTATDKDYSCENPPDNMLYELLNGGDSDAFTQYDIVDFTLSPKYNYRSEGTTSKDLECGRYSSEGIEWIEKNILNMSDSSIDKLKKALPSEPETEDGKLVCGSIYYDENEYCMLYDPINGGMNPNNYANKILEAKYDGTYYYLTVDGYRPEDYNKIEKTDDEGTPVISRTQWKLELKEMDEKKIWSIYECKSLHADWAVAYAEALMTAEEDYGISFDLKSEGQNKFQVAYITNDDIPEIVFQNLDWRGMGDSLILTNYNGKVVGELLYGRVNSYIEKGGKFIDYEGDPSDLGVAQVLYYINDEKIYEKGFKGEGYGFGPDYVAYEWEDNEISEAEYNEKMSQAYNADMATDIDDNLLDGIVTENQMYNWLMLQPPELQ